MITTPQEYLNQLAKINDKNRQILALLLPSNEKIYSIDLNSRTVEAPEFLSVVSDHQSETIYFKFDRYYDNQDLIQTSIFILFKNKKDPQKRSWAYAVPYIDPYTYGQDGKVLIPWVIGGAATEYSGDVEFAICFFKLDNEDNLIYRLMTLPAISKVLKGTDPNEYYEDNDEYFEIANEYESLLSRINKIENRDIIWLEAY